MKLFSATAVAGLAALLCAAAVGATTIVPPDDPGELALHSRAVFLARAGASSVEATAGYLSTVTELEVLRVVKGELAVSDRIRARVPGGVRDGIGSDRQKREEERTVMCARFGSRARFWCRTAAMTTSPRG